MEDNKLESSQDKKRRTVVLKDQHIEKLHKFFTHFKLQPTDRMRSAMSGFMTEEGKTIENQDMITIELAKMIIEAKDGLLKDIKVFQDPVFDQVREISKKRLFDLSFDYDVQETLGKKD